MAEELALLDGGDGGIAELEKRLHEACARLVKAGAALSKRRKAAARRLSPRIESELAELGMPKAVLRIALTTPRSSAVAGGDLTGCGSSGWDSCAFWVRLNPGHPEARLEEVASGGEVARLLLAIKAVLAGCAESQSSVQVPGPAVCVFDELDASIGGRLGLAVGRRLRAIAAGGTQVLCVTHLPQVAAFADQHHCIRKQEADGMTCSTLEKLGKQARLKELAAMSGVAEDVSQAKKLLALAVA